MFCGILLGIVLADLPFVRQMATISDEYFWNTGGVLKKIITIYKKWLRAAPVGCISYNMYTGLLFLRCWSNVNVHLYK